MDKSDTHNLKEDRNGPLPDEVGPEFDRGMSDLSHTTTILESSPNDLILISTADAKLCLPCVIKNTFLHFTEISYFFDAEEIIAPKRSNSAPPSLTVSGRLRALMNIARTLPSFTLDMEKTQQSVSIAESQHKDSKESVATTQEPTDEADGRIFTIMMKNIPCLCSAEDVCKFIDDADFEGQYNYFKLPIRHRQRGDVNMGYAFVGFSNPDATRRFAQQMSGVRLNSPSGNSWKLVSVAPARVQGIINRNSKVGASLTNLLTIHRMICSGDTVPANASSPQERASPTTSAVRIERKGFTTEGSPNRSDDIASSDSWWCPHSPRGGTTHGRSIAVPDGIEITDRLTTLEISKASARMEALQTSGLPRPREVALQNLEAAKLLGCLDFQSPLRPCQELGDQGLEHGSVHRDKERHRRQRTAEKPHWEEHSPAIGKTTSPIFEDNMGESTFPGDSFVPVVSVVEYSVKSAAREM